MALQTKYITLDEFQEYFPDIDLVEELGTTEKALALLKQVEDKIASYIDSNFNKNIDVLYPEFTDYQKEHYKQALLWQVYYVKRNGRFTSMSGIDGERGVILTQDALARASICEDSIEDLRLCGLWNRNLRRRRGLFNVN